jgi:hypothetical protein
VTMSTLSSTNSSASLIIEVSNPLPPPYKFDVGLSARIFLFCIARSPIVVSEHSLRRVQVRREVHDMGWPDLLVSDVMVMMAADECRG